MANNNRQQQVAFQAAEAALRAAETYLGNNVNSVTALTVNFNSAAPMIGLYSQRAPMTGVATYPLPAGFDIYNDNDWLTAGNTVEVNTLTSVTQRPRYLIEYVGRVGPPPTNTAARNRIPVSTASVSLPSAGAKAPRRTPATCCKAVTGYPFE